LFEITTLRTQRRIAQPVPSEAKESSLLLAATAQPFSRFFQHTGFAKLGNPTQSGGEYGGAGLIQMNVIGSKGKKITFPGDKAWPLGQG